jgi:steroid delta-isomerase-like uncharacterized protein
MNFAERGQSMASKNVETVRNAHESWNRRDFEDCVRNLTDNCVYTDHARGEKIHGKHKFTNYVEDWAKAMTDGKITEPRYIDAGDVVVTEFIAEGTNDGPFAGLPPTRRHVKFSFCEIWHFDKNGHMTSGGCYYDLYSIFTQLGHVKPLATAA